MGEVCFHFRRRRRFLLLCHFGSFLWIRRSPDQGWPPALSRSNATTAFLSDAQSFGEAQVLKTSNDPCLSLKMRPVHPGCSVGYKDPDPKFTVAGTFGALVKDGKNSYILSNNHVLADQDRLPPGSPIFQPGLLDSGHTDSDQIAELTKAVALQVRDPNHVDCAIAKLMELSLAS